MLRPVRAGEAAEIIGLGFRQEGRGEDRRGILRREAIASEPFLADPGLLDEHDSRFLIMPRALADIPSDKRVPNGCGKRNTASALAVAVACDQPHWPVSCAA